MKTTGIARRMLNWTDRKFNEVCDNENEKHPYIKAFALGGVEGLIDGAVIGFPILLVSCIVAGKQLKKLKE